MIRVEWDERGLEKAARQAVSEHVRRSQPAMDRFCRRYAGRSAPEVRRALKRQYHELGLTVARKELDAHAQIVSDGGAIRLEA